MKVPRDAASRGYLLLFGYFAFLTLLLWPEPSYYRLLRYGTVPTLFSSLPFLLPLGVLASALHLGVAHAAETAAPTLSPGRFLRVMTLRLITLLALATPYVAVAVGLSNAPVYRGALLLLPVAAWAFLLYALGSIITAVTRFPTIRQLIAWGSAGALLTVTGLYLPRGNPLSAVAAAAEVSTPWLASTGELSLLFAVLLPAGTAGILTLLMVRLRR